MTMQVDQEEAISILTKLEALPIAPEIKVENKENIKSVCRKYKIKTNNTKYSEMDAIVIKYKMSRYTERVKDYCVYLTGKFDDVVYLCKYSKGILNTLFGNIILLELGNWRRITQGLEPLKEMEDYVSLMFELDIENKRNNRLLENKLDKDFSFKKAFPQYQNSNKIIPIKIWKSKLVPIL